MGLLATRQLVMEDFFFPSFFPQFLPSCWGVSVKCVVSDTVGCVGCVSCLTPVTLFSPSPVSFTTIFRCIHPLQYPWESMSVAFLIARWLEQ